MPAACTTVCGAPNTPSAYGRIAMLAFFTVVLVGIVAVSATASAEPSGDQSGCVAHRIAGSGTAATNAPVAASRMTSEPLSATTSCLPSGEYAAQPIASCPPIAVASAG